MRRIVAGALRSRPATDRPAPDRGVNHLPAGKSGAGRDWLRGEAGRVAGGY